MAKKEAERQMVAEEAARQRASTDQMGADPLKIVQAGIIATFGRRRRRQYWQTEPQWTRHWRQKKSSGRGRGNNVGSLSHKGIGHG